MKPDSLAFRLVASAILWSVAVLVAGGLVLASVLRETVERTFDTRLSAFLESLIAASEVTPEGQLILLRDLGEPRFGQPFSGWYWQIESPEAVVLRSRSLWDNVLSAPAMEDGVETAAIRYRTAVGPLDEALRIATRRITLPGSSTPFVFRLAGELSEVRDETRRFNVMLAWALGALGFGLAVAVFVQVHFGLIPLRRLGRALSEIRFGRAGRLDGAYPTEIAPLVQELNALLDHNRVVLERARGNVADLAHALKTPLSVLTNEGTLDRGPLGRAVRSQAARMQRQIDHALARARTAGADQVLGARTRVARVVSDLGRTLQRIYAERSLAIELECSPTAVFRGERQDLEEMVGNLLDNACKWAKSHVRVNVEVADERLTLRVEDDGPGLPLDQARAVLERGTRLDEQVEGSGLGLAIVRDIANLYGGSVTLDRSPLGGLRVTLDLPGTKVENRSNSASATGGSDAET